MAVHDFSMHSLFVASVRAFLQELWLTIFFEVKLMIMHLKQEPGDGLLTLKDLYQMGKTKTLYLTIRNVSAFSILWRREFCRQKTHEKRLHCRPTSLTPLLSLSPTFLVSCASCFRSLPIFTLSEFIGPVSRVAIFNSIITFDFYFSMLFSVLMVHLDWPQPFRQQTL